MQHLWSVLCRQALTDERTNNVSLIHVFDQLNISDPNALDAVNRRFVRHSLALVTSWVRDEWEVPEREDIVVEFRKLETDEPLLNFEYVVDLSTQSRARQESTFEELPYAGDGMYAFISARKLDGAWRQVGIAYLLINLIEPMKF